MASTLCVKSAFLSRHKSQWRTIAVQGMCINFKNLSYHRSYAVTDVWKNYKNNIILNYVDYVRRFINTHFRAGYQRDAVRVYRNQLLTTTELPDGMSLVEYKTYVSIAVRRFRDQTLYRPVCG